VKAFQLNYPVENLRVITAAVETEQAHSRKVEVEAGYQRKRT
jgi:hypothetical protein